MKNNSSARRIKVMRRVVAPVFALTAVVCIVFGVLNATIWKPNPTVSAQARLTAQYVVTDPGVLGLVDDEATLTASLVSASDSGSKGKNEICVATGNAQDATGWMSGHTYQRIKGLDSWTELQTGDQQLAGKPAAHSDSTVDFRHSDMWQQVECSSSKVTMHTNAGQTGQVAIISVEPTTPDNNQEKKDDKKPQPKIAVQMDWQRHQLPNFAMPFYFAGALLILLAVLSATVFCMEPSKLRNKKSNKYEEVPQMSVAQAFGQTIRSIFARSQNVPDKHSEHGAVPEDKVVNQPKVVDISATNMLDDQQVGKYASPVVANDTYHGQKEESTVAAPFQDYIQRFLNETTNGSSSHHSQKYSYHDALNDDTSYAGIAGGANQADLDDSTVGSLLRDRHESYAGDIDDRTRIDTSEGISDETSHVYERSRHARNRRRKHKMHGERGV